MPERERDAAGNRAQRADCRAKIWTDAQAYEKVGIIRSGFSEMMVPRTIHAPVRSSAPPISTMVPPFICKPAKSFTGPRTAITPRRIRMPSSIPATAGLTPGLR